MRHWFIVLCLAIAYFLMALWRGGSDFRFFLPTAVDMLVIVGLAIVVAFACWIGAGRPSWTEMKRP